MPLLLLIDGYNVLAPVSPPRRPDPMWLHRERMQLIARLAEHLSEPLRRCTQVVFDAANPPRDRPHRFELHQIDVQFSVDYPEADDLIEEIIRGHSAPKSLAVVSSDRRVQTAARRRSATPFESQQWLDDLLDGKLSLAIDRQAVDKLFSKIPGQQRPGDPSSQGGEGQGSYDEKPGSGPEDNDPDDVDQWMREFGF